MIQVYSDFQCLYKNIHENYIDTILNFLINQISVFRKIYITHKGSYLYRLDAH